MISANDVNVRDTAASAVSPTKANRMKQIRMRKKKPGPPRSPGFIVSRLNQEVNRLGGLADVRERFLQQGIEAKTGTAEAFAALVRDELVKWGKVIRTANIKVE